MISLIRGTIFERTSEGAVILAGGVGYSVVLPTTVTQRLGDVGDEVLLRTHLSVKEDNWTLYGFLENEELEMFRLLQGIQGIGPRSALNFLCDLTPSDIVRAVLNRDETTFTRVHGIGKKRARKLLFELSDKLDPQAWSGNTPFHLDGVGESGSAGRQPSGERSEAALALRELGYSDGEVAEALGWACQDSPELPVPVEQLVHKALMFLGRQR